MKQILFVLAIVLFPICSALGQTDNPRLEAVRTYILEKDYPEVFGDTHYKTRVEGFLDADIDNDGSKEIVILFFPHYLQSAPILIYKIAPDLKVTRIPEGLAPGPVQPISGDYLDSHNLGEGIDFTVGKPEDFIKIMQSNSLNGAVLYDSFIHIDGRKGLPYLIDMRGVKLPEKTKNCGSFEFSRVKQIAAGHIREDATKNYLAAWVNHEIYVYLMDGVSKDGLLKKKLWIVKAPSGFNGFDTNDSLAYTIGKNTSVLTLK